MDLQDLLGRIATLTVVRSGQPGVWLAVDSQDARPDAPAILLPRAEVPEDAREGQELEVFVYLDSEDRPIATTRTPLLVLGEVAFLNVVQEVPFGVFVDWGLPKDLLVPRAEQIVPIKPGERHAFGLMIDRSGRLAATMRISEMLEPRAPFRPGDWVEGEAWRKEPELGVFVIIERRFLGLLPEGEPHQLRRGTAGTFRVANVLPDGKIELSLRGPAHEEIEDDARMILASLGSARPPRVGDHTSPEEIRALFGLSKKAFKRAVGRLLKLEQVEHAPEGYLRVRKGQ